jgi:hypothetical protein
MGPSVPVPIPKPRTPAALQHDDEALRVRANVVECLTDYVKTARRRPGDRPRSAVGVAELAWPFRPLRWKNRGKARPIESES